MRVALVSIAVALLHILPTVAHADPGVLESGFTVRKFATIPQPVGIGIAPDGTVYAGNDPPGNGFGEPARIRKISPDGSTVVEIGPLLPDPDTVIVDVAGDVGNSGEVIVGAGSSLVGLDPATGNATTLFSGRPLSNIGHMAFDDAGRLFVAGGGRSLLVVDATSVMVFTNFGGKLPAGMAPDGGNTLYTVMSSGELYDVGLDGFPPFFLATFGTAIDDIAYGGGAFGNRVFAGDRFGNILVYDPVTGEIDLFAQGFARANSLEFGPDGSLYVSDFAGDAIWVIEAPPALEATPGAAAFGEVAAIWSTKTNVVTLSNVGSGDVTVKGVSLASGSHAYFSIASAPADGTVLAPGATADVEVMFAPDELGDFKGTLLVESTDALQPLIEIPLSGTGVDADLTAAEMLDLLLALYQDYVDAGLLEGTGRGRSAAKRLNAHYNLLVNVARHLDKGNLKKAGAHLTVALKLADGHTKPPDLVTGEAAPRLAFLIEVVIAELDDTAPRKDKGDACRKRSRHKDKNHRKRGD